MRSVPGIDPGSCENRAVPAPLRVPTYYDFASTLCYVAHRVFGEMQAEIAALGIALEWVPLDLADLLGWRRGFPVEPMRLANAERVAAEHGVKVRPLALWPDSRDANAFALTLARGPHEAAFRERVFCGVFEERRALEAPGTLEAFARDLGLEIEPRRLARARDELEFRTRIAQEEEVTGVPTLMLGEFPFGGVQSRQTTRMVLERWAERKRAAASAG
jgi:predicted DsbA family dithiol-disulfide isomerase